MLSNRENILNFYNHKPMDAYVSYTDGIRLLLESDFHHERPPYMTSGKDWFGVDWVWDAGLITYVPDHRQKPILEDITQWREVIQWPNFESLNWKEATKIDKINENIDREKFVFSFWLTNGPFERLHSLMGFENALMALLEEEDEVKAYLEKWTEWRCKFIDYVCEYYKPDVIQCHDDSGTALSTFYSKSTWKKLFKPCWAAMAKQIKKNGVIPELHSCGKSQELFIDLGDTEFETLFIQSINDYDYIRKNIGRSIGIIPTDFCTPLVTKGQTGGITVKEIYDAVDKFVEKNIEKSHNDFLMMMFPPTMQLGDVAQDKVLTGEAEIFACAFEYSIVNAPELSKIVEKRNAELATEMN